MIDSRARGGMVRRRRQCANGHRFTSVELAGDVKDVLALFAKARALSAAVAELGT